MARHPRAGQPALAEDLIDVDAVVGAYYDITPDPDNIDQQVVFGTSGHRGSSLDGKFNELHIAATTQAIVEYRAGQGIAGPLYLGKDTHALSLPAWQTAIEVLVANGGVHVRCENEHDYTPDPRRSPGRSSCSTPPVRPVRPTASWSPPLAQPAPPRRRLQVQPAARWPPRRHRRDQLDRRPGQRADEAADRDPAYALCAGEVAGDRARLSDRLLHRPRQGPRPGRDPRGHSEHRGRSDGRRLGAVLGATSPTSSGSACTWSTRRWIRPGRS